MKYVTFLENVEWLSTPCLGFLFLKESFESKCHISIILIMISGKRRKVWAYGSNPPSVLIIYCTGGVHVLLIMRIFRSFTCLSLLLFSSYHPPLWLNYSKILISDNIIKLLEKMLSAPSSESSFLLTRTIIRVSHQLPLIASSLYIYYFHMIMSKSQETRTGNYILPLWSSSESSLSFRNLDLFIMSQRDLRQYSR